MVRCFEDDDIIHELGSVDPSDIEIINTELILADIAATHKRLSTREKKAKEETRTRSAAGLDGKLIPHLRRTPSPDLELSSEEEALLKDFCLLSSKRTIFACNVSEDELSSALENPGQHPMVLGRFYRAPTEPKR